MQRQDYRIFVAEVASTVNETLLLKYILSTTQDENMKKYLLNYFLVLSARRCTARRCLRNLSRSRTGLVEAGTPLTSENLSAEYLKLNKQYYGDAIVHDEQIAYEWSRIPHFYTSFYVYNTQPALSAPYPSSTALTEGETAVRDYKEFLSSGGSDSPVELLKIAGVDLTKPQAFEAAMKEFEDTLARFEEMMLKK